MLAAFSPGSDFKRYYRGRMPRLALIVIILMPLTSKFREVTVGR